MTAQLSHGGELSQLRRELENLEAELREDISGTREIASHAARDAERAHQALDGLEERIERRLRPQFDRINGSIEALRTALVQGRQRDAELERRLGSARKVANSAQDLAREAKEGLEIARVQSVQQWNELMEKNAREGRTSPRSVSHEWVRVGVAHGSKELVKWLTRGGIVVVISTAIALAKQCFGG